MSGMETVDLSGVRVLVVDDEADIRRGLRMLLEPLGLVVADAASGAEALAAVATEPADIVLTDLQMPGMSGTELLAELKKRPPSPAVFVLTGFGTIQAAVWCLQNGAAHFLTKPFDNDEIRRLVTRVARQIQGARDVSAASPRDMVGARGTMRSVLDLVARVAPSPVPVLVEGETGTGKELVAREIHRRSAVSHRPFLAVNVAAVPDTLLESEFFGHEAGAFTDARERRDGLLVRVDGGTLFLDELPSMSLPFQGKLLRVLQERVVRPLGSTREVPVDFRLVCAANRDLQSMVRAGEFREDLYYRLRVVSIPVPPLRERKEEVLPLARHFLLKASRDCLGPGAPVPELSVPAGRALEEYRWPGNVRELENAIQRAVVVCSGPRILPHHLGLEGTAWTVQGRRDPEVYEEGKRRAVERFQREFVARALERTSGNLSRAAEECGLTRAALQRILKQLDMDRESFAG